MRYGSPFNQNLPGHCAQVKSGTIFDNIFVGDSLEEAEAFTNATWGKSKDAEKEMQEKVRGAVSSVGEEDGGAVDGTARDVDWHGHLGLAGRGDDSMLRVSGLSCVTPFRVDAPDCLGDWAP